jgi:hemoglobin-like flavoprotein
MTPEQIAQVQQSFAKVAPMANDAAALFYSRLFEIAPELRPLFRGDMAEQGRKLMATLAIVVHGLTRLDAILPAASALAKRHVGYGVKADHYAPVGAALLWTLERSLGSQWTPDLASAWATAYTTRIDLRLGPCVGGPAPRGRNPGHGCLTWSGARAWSALDAPDALIQTPMVVTC